MTTIIPQQYQSLKTKLETIVKKVVSPQEITANSDLNDYTEVGMYYCNLDSTGLATLLNAPSNVTSEGNGFCLFVENTNVYYIEVAYRKGAFIVFVNENENEEYHINLSFDNVFNMKYKNSENDELKEKEFSFTVKEKNYYYLKLKAINEGEYGYNINLKIKKINQDN